MPPGAPGFAALIAACDSVARIGIGRGAVGRAGRGTPGDYLTVTEVGRSGAVMPVRGLPKLEERWRRERLYRERHSAQLCRTVLEAGVPVLERHGVQRAWLFGSVAAGTAGPDSDVDILAVPVPPDAFWPLRRDLEAALGCSLDLCTQGDDPAFVRKIQERGELIHDLQP